MILPAAACTLCMATSCGTDDAPDVPDTDSEQTDPYVISLGITASGTTTYYVVSTDDLMNATISAEGRGIEQNGYHDYEPGNATIFCVGGLGLTDVKGVSYGDDGALRQNGSFVLDRSPKIFTQITSREMMAVEIPDNPAGGSEITFYRIDIDGLSVISKTPVSILPLAALDWPSITGLAFSENKVYLTYFPMNQTTWETAYTDTAYVAVFTYPGMTLETIMKDTRTGASGSWNAYNGIFKADDGDMYVMSNSAIANGFSQSTKHAAFLHIPAGATQFDSYFFDFEAQSGGLKPAHIKYLGNGLLFAEVSTLNPQTMDDRWSDRALKSCIIDLEAKTVRDVSGIPVHNGDGGRRFTAMTDGQYVYTAIATDDGLYIYRTDPATATATRGARISATFVAGLFRLPSTPD
jgi:hypothetical protein